MGIYIGKVKMPTGNEKLHLTIHADSKVETTLIDGDKTTVYKGDYIANEVEPHGRTIESNLFLIRLRNEMFHKTIDINDETYEKIRKIVAGMDTVVQPEYEFEQYEFLRTAKKVSNT